MIILCESRGVLCGIVACVARRKINSNGQEYLVARYSCIWTRVSADILGFRLFIKNPPE